MRLEWAEERGWWMGGWCGFLFGVVGCWGLVACVRLGGCCRWKGVVEGKEWCFHRGLGFVPWRSVNTSFRGSSAFLFWDKLVRVVGGKAYPWRMTDGTYGGHVLTSWV